MMKTTFFKLAFCSAIAFADVFGVNYTISNGSDSDGAFINDFELDFTNSEDELNTAFIESDSGDTVEEEENLVIADDSSDDTMNTSFIMTEQDEYEIDDPMNTSFWISHEDMAKVEALSGDDAEELLNFYTEEGQRNKPHIKWCDYSM